MEINRSLVIAGCLSILVAMMHVGCILGGPDWYRFFGAGEQMAQMAAVGDMYPTIVTAIISVVLGIWGLYAFSGAGLIFKLPLLKTCLVLITSVYLIRGVAGFILPFVTDSPAIHQNTITFWLVSSTVCCVYGIYYFIGTKRLWR